MKEKIKQGRNRSSSCNLTCGCVLWDKLDCDMWNYKTDYHVFRMGVQLGSLNRYMANNMHIGKHF